MPTIGRLKFGDLMVAGKINERTQAITNGLIAHYPFDNTAIGEDWNKKRNLVDYSQWKLGTSGSQGSFNQNGTTSENQIVRYPNPWGIDDTIWGCLNNDVTSDADGGWNYNSAPVDNTKTYRFSVWVRREDVGDGYTYFGPQTSTVSPLGSTTADSNPYFTSKNASNLPQSVNQWLLWVAHVRPYDYAGVTAHNDSGIYDITGKKVMNTMIDWKWLNTTTSSGHRAYLYYSTVTTEKQYMYHPRMEMLDGYENTVQELIMGIEDKIDPAINTNTTLRTTGLSVDSATVNLADGVSYGAYASATQIGDYYALPNPEDKTSQKYVVNGVGSVARGRKNLPAVTGKTYIMSIVMKITGAGSMYVSPSKPNPEASNTINVTTVRLATIDLGGGWFKIIELYTIVSNTVASCIFCFGISGGAVNDEFYVYDLQWEDKAYPTSYVAGTRASNSVFSIPKSMVPSTGTFVFEFMPRAFSANMPIFSTGVDGSSGGFDLLMPTAAGSGDTLFRCYNASNYFQASGSSSWFPTLFAWYEVAIAYTNNGSVTMYINGDPVITVPSIGDWFAAFTASGTGLYLGSGIRSATSMEFRNVSLYNRVLTAAEVLENYSPTKFKLSIDGNINMPVVEKPIGIPSDAYYWPLGETTLDTTFKFDAIVKDALTYRDGYAWVHSTTQANLFPTYQDTSNFGVKGASNFKTIQFDDSNVIYRYDYFGEGTNYKGHDIAVTSGTSYFFSIDVFVSSDFNGNTTMVAGIENIVANYFNYNMNRKGVWQRFTYTFTAPSSGIARLLMYPCANNSSGTKGYVLYRNPMFTASAYEVPFYKTTRMKGNLQFNLYNTIGLDWNSNWSIVYTKIPKGTSSIGNLTNYNIDTLGANSNSVGGGYKYWGKTTGADTLNITNGGIIATLTPSDYFNRPHMISIVKNGTNITWKFYGINGTITSHTQSIGTIASNYFVNQYGYDLKLGGWDNTNDCGSMFKDLFVVKRAMLDADLDLMWKRQMRVKNGRLEVQGGISDGYVF